MANPAAKLRVLLRETIKTSDQRLAVLHQLISILEVPKGYGLIPHAQKLMAEYKAMKLVQEARQ